MPSKVPGGRKNEHFGLGINDWPSYIQVTVAGNQRLKYNRAGKFRPGINDWPLQKHSWAQTMCPVEYL